MENIERPLSVENDVFNGQQQQQQQQQSVMVSNNSYNEPMSKINGNQPKRLHVSNIPFRYRDPDLRTLFGVRFIL